MSSSDDISQLRSPVQYDTDAFFFGNEQVTVLPGGGGGGNGGKDGHGAWGVAPMMLPVNW